MAVMGTDSVILDDLRGRVAELEALVPRLFSVIAEKDAIIAELTATVKEQAAQIADLKGKLAAANKNSSNSSMPLADIQKDIDEKFGAQIDNKKCLRDCRKDVEKIRERLWARYREAVESFGTVFEMEAK